MARYLFAVVLVTVITTTASAEPLPWSYYVRFSAATAFDGILLNPDQGPVIDPFSETTPSKSNLWAIPTGLGNFGFSRINFQTDTATTTLFTFGKSDAIALTDAPMPGQYSNQGFQLSWGFGNSTSGITYGLISAVDPTGSGLERLFITLDQTDPLNIDGIPAEVRFQGFNDADSVRIDMTVSRLDVAQTPEPGTITMVGIGLSALVGFSLRRRRSV